MLVQLVNPANGKSEFKYHTLSKKDILNKIDLSENVFPEWKITTFNKRRIILVRAAEILRKNKQQYAMIVTREMGKRLVESEAEIEKCAWLCDYYANNAAAILQNEVVSTEAFESYIRFDPLGLIFAVMPWNFPFWQVFRFAVPAMMAGNTVLVKLASNVPNSSSAIEEIFLKAGLKRGVFQHLLISSLDAETLIKDIRVKAVTLTGSAPAGASVASLAAKNLKKCVLELGGSDPFIVLENADIKKAAASAAQSRMLVSGQTCISAKRFIVQKKVFNEFISNLKAEFEKRKIGDPADPHTDVGPLSSEQILNKLHMQVTKSIKLGAECLTGGKRIKRPGYYYPPTILSRVSADMPVWNEETFGPVAAVRSFETDNEAIKLANGTSFGLGASLWTSDLKRAKNFIRQIESGCIFVNSIVKSDPRLPFGGIKESGFGRELSNYGIKEFVNIKTVWINSP